MRIVKFVFGGLMVGLLVIFGFVYGREKLLLAMASYQLRADVASLKQTAFSGKVQCVSSRVEGYQLRFISETDYVLEAICGAPSDEGLFGEGRLKFGVKRLYGSGIMTPLVEGIPVVSDAWVNLVYEKSQTVVGLFDGLPKVKWNVNDYEVGGASPAVGSCDNWGFQCCNSGMEVGEGARVRTYDCANYCYQHCNRLPIALFFNTDPLLNQITRVLSLSKSNSMVRFGFEITDDDQMKSVYVDFGDGQKSAPLSAKTSDLTHEYRCGKSECVFEAKLVGVDVAGNQLVESDINKVIVIVR